MSEVVKCQLIGSSVAVVSPSETQENGDATSGVQETIQTAELERQAASEEAEGGVSVELQDLALGVDTADKEPLQPVLEAQEFVLEVQFQEDFKNLFLFNELTKVARHDQSLAATRVRFSGRRSKLKQAYAALELAIGTSSGKPPDQVSMTKAVVPSSLKRGLLNCPITSLASEDAQLVEGESEIISREQLLAVIMNASLRWRLDTWKLIYSLTRDGKSMDAFYESMRDVQACIVVLRDRHRNVFGGFCPQRWENHKEYYGTGECFVFDFKECGKDHPINVYKWTGKNNFFMYSTQQTIAMGGGQNFAISIDSDLKNGSSGACETFDSPRFTQDKLFRCSLFEVWGCKNDAFL